MGGKQSKVPRAPRVSDSLAGNYDALKPVAELRGEATSLTGKVAGTSARMGNTKSPNMGMAVLGQPVTVSAKEFKKNVRISSSSHGLA